MKHFNGLTPAQDERLALLIEECAEVIQAATKILRHGYESRHPEAPPHCTNRWDLSRELGDLRAAIVILVNAGDVQMTGVDGIQAFAKLKLRDLPQYLHHQTLGDYLGARIADVGDSA